MAKKSKFGISTYDPKIGRHKKRLNKGEKKNYKKYRGQGR